MRDKPKITKPERFITKESLVHLGNCSQVAICDIDEQNGEKLSRQLVGKYGKDNVIFCECDVTDYPQFEESFETVVETFGSVDIVINNAGIMNDRLWELEVDVNLVSVGYAEYLSQFRITSGSSQPKESMRLFVTINFMHLTPKIQWQHLMVE